MLGTVVSRALWKRGGALPTGTPSSKAQHAGSPSLPGGTSGRLGIVVFYKAATGRSDDR